MCLVISLKDEARLGSTWARFLTLWPEHLVVLGGGDFSSESCPAPGHESLCSVDEAEVGEAFVCDNEGLVFRVCHSLSLYLEGDEAFLELDDIRDGSGAKRSFERYLVSHVVSQFCCAAVDAL